MIRITLPWLVAMALVMPVGGLAAGPGYRLEVAGLACPFCSYGIEKQLRRIEGVATIEVDVRAGTVLVLMEDGHELQRRQAARAVERAGFTLDGFESHAPATGTKASHP